MTQPRDTGNYTILGTQSSHAPDADTQRQTDGIATWRTEVVDGTYRERYADAIRNQRNSDIKDTILVIVIVSGYLIAIVGGAAK